MVLNLSAATSLNSAQRKQPHYLLDDGIYTLLIEKIIKYKPNGGFEILRCPLLARLENQYRDQFYDFTELPQLIREIDEIKQEFLTNSSQAIEQLEILKQFCRDAQNANFNLYHFAD
jgi:hypothetical protein